MQTLDDVLTVVVVLTGLVFVPWVFIIRPLLRRRGLIADPHNSTPAKPQPQRPAPVVDLAADRNRWSVRGELARLFLVDERRPVMSNNYGWDAADDAVADPLPATSTIDGQGIAKPGNAVNEELTGNLLPEAAREIIRFQTRVEDVIAVVESGKLGQVEAIERIFKVKRSGRPDSPYARARAAVEAQMKPQRRELVGDMIERVQREVAAEH